MKATETEWEYRDGWLWYTRHHHKSRIGTRVGNQHPNGYWYYNNKLIHRMIWEELRGAVPTGYFVDHIDGDTSNNNIANLRLVTPSQSSANRGPMKVRTYPKGVRRFGNKYRAYIDGRHLGTYNTEEEAFAARVAAETPYHRETYFK